MVDMRWSIFSRHSLRLLASFFLFHKTYAMRKAATVRMGMTTAAAICPWLRPFLRKLRTTSHLEGDAVAVAEAEAVGVGVRPAPESDASEAESAAFASYVAKKVGPAMPVEMKGGIELSWMLIWRDTLDKL